ncbi:peptidyl-prolyl cis-trans isomerase cyp15 [Gilbertella persicaria]|uniref:peptidyl-prolyl cis-trans isomerase cyp15 n=1 Tax=Gilbertella persicaria TaxID=101096 RepID=UPI00221E5EA4|nr:peptidyl-prolyl cis-trans isomerase cyp15 [Gilbertella persicaria]KAI8082643.1 peptidyl-prolyl cis-trans isomerase cyp15 [Gilbertella persicaria]
MADDLNPNNKRLHEEEPDLKEESDDDIGPALPPPPGEEVPKKRKKTLAYERLYLEHLPEADMYEKSYMHRDILNQVAVTKNDFVVTTSVDGHLKFWKKTAAGIEFVKHYKSHLSTIVDISLSADNELLATVSDDMALKVYDITNFDMINMIKLKFKPKAVCWIHQKGQAQALVAVSEAGNSNIHIYDGRSDGKPLHTLSKMHAKPVHLIEFNSRFNTVVSVDALGMIEYWSPEEPFSLPDNLDFELKSQTDLYEFRKKKSVPTCLTFSPDGLNFVTMSFPDRQVRLFKFLTGKKYREYDESLHVISEMQQAGTSSLKLDDMEFGRRLAVEKELEKSNQAKFVNAVFDETGNFIIYGALLGIKVVNTLTNKVVRIIGKSESNRFVNMGLYQGAPRKKGVYTLAMAASDNAALKESQELDPTLFCTAFNKNRFYMFTRREPFDHGQKGSERDVFNEKPSREEQTVAATQERKQVLGTSAIIRTTSGDIHMRLFPDAAPKAVENFITHSKNGYYDNLIFHRIIKGFMIQTGCPFGDGTGGESIWGDDFEDEFSRDYRHDRPYTVSMANAGPNTNGSQFFITVAPATWLDNKHSVFGRVTAGMDVVHSIEHVRVDKTNKPYEDIKILNIEIR